MRLRLYLAFLTPLIASFAAEFPSEVKLTNGATLRNSSPVRWTSDSVVIKHAGGADPIRFANIAEPSRSLVLASRDAAKAVPKATAQPAAAATPASTRKVAGEAFLGGGESQGIRVKFAGLRVAAYKLEEAQQAFNTKLTPVLPTPVAEVDADGEGRFELELPAGVPVMIVAKGKHRAAKGGRVTDWEWRVPESEIRNGRVMLHDANAYSLPTSTINRR